MILQYTRPKRRMNLTSLGLLRKDIVKNKTVISITKNNIGYILYKLEQDNIACGLRFIVLSFHNSHILTAFVL